MSRTMDTSVLPTTALEIRRIRARTGLTQTAFANAYNIPMRTLQDWERGLREPPAYLPNLLNIAVTVRLDLQAKEK